ncbi:MAG TPA: phosphoribosyltransferase family protein, partial [Sphingobacterium sp.]|nr:phosphoribosyltransferase family protein [Sphingobacterium sp.]
GVGTDLWGRHVIVVEDIVDTGNSLAYTLSALEKMNVASISVCTLLLKPDSLLHDFDNIMYVGFEIGKEFVIGYGLDYNRQCRNLPNIYKVVGGDESI